MVGRQYCSRKFLTPSTILSLYKIRIRPTWNISDTREPEPVNPPGLVQNVSPAWSINYLQIFNRYSTDRRIQYFLCSTTNSMADVRATYIPRVHQSRSSHDTYIESSKPHYLHIPFIRKFPLKPILPINQYNVKKTLLGILLW